MGKDRGEKLSDINLQKSKRYVRKNIYYLVERRKAYMYQVLVKIRLHIITPTVRNKEEVNPLSMDHKPRINRYIPRGS